MTEKWWIGNADHDPLNSVNELRPDMTGRWVVMTESGTRHVFDFTRQTYTRFPSGNPLESDGSPMVFDPDMFLEWPSVGQAFLLCIPMNVLDKDGWMSVRLKFRSSNTITAITKEDDDAHG